jgi:hypothetical protein
VPILLNAKSGGRPDLKAYVLDRLQPHDQIDSADYPYFVCGYVSNHVGYVGYHLEMVPNVPLYIY